MTTFDASFHETDSRLKREQSKIGVLLVDDHAMVRQGLVALLNAEQDFVVLGEADSVADALRLIESAPPRIVIADISLREGDGLDLTRRITDRWPEILTIVLSMHDEGIYAERALRAGARGYVRKVDVAETVLTAIRRVLEGEIYVNPAMASQILNRVAGARRANSQETPLARLTDRELEVLQWIGRGMSNREIASELFISVKTVETHREHLKQKLKMSSSGDLLRYAIEFYRVRT